jgi:hypothetical protein
MIKNPISKVDVARNYRDEHGPEMPTLKLARIMYGQNSLLFKDVEDARNSSCEELKVKRERQRRYKITHAVPVRSLNPYKLPDSDETEFEPYKIKGHSRVAVFSDIHAPYHSKGAITAAIAFVKKEKPDALLLNGDTIDCHKLSRFHQGS